MLRVSIKEFVRDIMAVVGLFLILAAALTLSGCGYFMAGTWEDDPGNWKRAFQSTQPLGVNVTHSKYWRSPHWTYEFGYFFEISSNTALREQLFTNNKMQRITGKDAAEAMTHLLEAPPWFAPKAAIEYEIWKYAEEPRGHFRMFIDKGTGDVFLSDYQL